MSNAFPTKENLTICFSHVAYQMGTTFAKRQTDIAYFEAWRVEDLNARIAEADVLVVSGFWHNDLLNIAPRLKFIQSIGAGYDQFPLDRLKQQGIRLTSAKGVNRNAVSEHALAHALALARHIHTGRDYQRQHQWRGMLSDLTQREDELGGKTMLIIGFGDIGSRVAKLAKAFDMRVLAVKRNPDTAQGPADEVHASADLSRLLPQADFVVLTCPLTPKTEKIIDGPTLAAMSKSAYLINMARGPCVDEAALIQALQNKAIAGAGLDTFEREPLSSESPLWDMENVIITPHTGGETRRYEENVVDILLENLEKLWQGEEPLRNQIV